MELSRLGRCVALLAVALSAVGMWFSLDGHVNVAGIFVALSLVMAFALNSVIDKPNRLTRL